MSATANWSYTNKATVWPLTEQNGGWDNNLTYGDPYTIDCTWKGGGETAIDNQGQEFVSKMTFYHEDDRVKFGDLIAMGEGTDISLADAIRSHAEFDMSFFAEAPDYVSLT